MDRKMPEVLLGKALVQGGKLKESELALSLSQQRLVQQQGSTVQLSELLIRNRFCTADDIARVQVFAARAASVSADVPLLTPLDCVRYQVLPVGVQEGTLTVKVSRLLSSVERDLIMRACTVEVAAVESRLVDRHEMIRGLQQQAAHESFEVIVERLKGVGANSSATLLNQAIEAMLHEAIDRRASDIHIDFRADPDCLVSMRIDSALRRHVYPHRVIAPIVSRIKTIGGMDASNNKTAMDGRTSIEHRGRMVNVRIATRPIVDGEMLTLRIIDSAALRAPKDLFPKQPGMIKLIGSINHAHGKSGGFMLVTGPVGSGKSSTLYTVAAGFPRISTNVTTVEDPVEYILPFTRQIQLQQALKELASDMERSVLRHDPDVLVFGEIRDADSAKTAIKFAEAGHFVLATLHANDAPQSIDRLLSMVHETDRSEAAYVLASTLRAVVNQILFVRLCACAKLVGAGEAQKAVHEHTWLKDAFAERGGGKMKVAQGCSACEQTGYRGRVVVHDTLTLELTPKQRVEAARTLAASGTGASLQSLPGVSHIARRQVAAVLLFEGIIDLDTALTVVAGQALSSEVVSA